MWYESVWPYLCQRLVQKYLWITTKLHFMLEEVTGGYKFL